MTSRNFIPGVTAVWLLLSMLLSFMLPAVAHYVPDDTSDNVSNNQPVKKTTRKNSQQFDPWRLLDFALTPAYAAITHVRIYTEGMYRFIQADGIPDHPTGQFPNAHNPNVISEQNYHFRVPLSPQAAANDTPIHHNIFGVAINGVPFDPGANEFWNHDRNSGWQYEPMSPHVNLGLDASNAHVQPNGAYHYHGMPNGLLERLAASPTPVLLGYAADGFPIYGPFGYSAERREVTLAKLRSSYRLKSGTRSGGPGGAYDGTFIQDYEYVSGAGELDECNGRFGVTPEYPSGIYHYVITDGFPFIPRAWKGIPDQSMMKQPRLGPPGSHPPNSPPPGPPPGFGPPFGADRE